jgi:predicted ArsR family transcriptional regulator
VSDLQALPELQQAILSLLKKGRRTLGELSDDLNVSFEAVRRQVQALHLQGFVDKSLERQQGVGRPQSRYGLSHAGEHLFPKAYDDLAVELIDHVAERLGAEALDAVLDSFIEARVQRWHASMQGKSLPERLELLREIYREEDPHTSVERSPDGYRLIERNCPFFSVAHRRPALCRVTVDTLRRLLGYEVVREEKFQAGDGRCVFRVLEAAPIELRLPQRGKASPA